MGNTIGDRCTLVCAAQSLYSGEKVRSENKSTCMSETECKCKWWGTVDDATPPQLLRKKLEGQ